MNLHMNNSNLASSIHLYLKTMAEGSNMNVLTR